MTLAITKFKYFYFKEEKNIGKGMGMCEFERGFCWNSQHANTLDLTQHQRSRSWV